MTHAAKMPYALRRGLVHRDIKPANLIIERETDSLKILDLGVVRRVQEDSTSMFGVPVGTYCHMSPEQRRGVLPFDIWGLSLA